ncbi:MAG: hypothetical protein IPL12_10920 [Bacteroidetes bacterium]|nr:hypothetical protein [Bacteroidota bacterium]
MKISDIGLIQWQQTIGGTLGESLTYIDITNDGGYIVSGASNSGIGGDKTENLIGYMDLWILKLNSLGNIIWQNTIGGDGEDGVLQKSINSAMENIYLEQVQSLELWQINQNFALAL